MMLAAVLIVSLTEDSNRQMPAHVPAFTQTRSCYILLIQQDQHSYRPVEGDDNCSSKCRPKLDCGTSPSLSHERSVHIITYTAPPDTYIHFTLYFDPRFSHADHLKPSGALHATFDMPEATCTQTPRRPCLSDAEGRPSRTFKSGWTKCMPHALDVCNALSQHCPKARSSRIACCAAGH